MPNVRDISKNDSRIRMINSNKRNKSLFVVVGRSVISFFKYIMLILYEIPRVLEKDIDTHYFTIEFCNYSRLASQTRLWLEKK